MDLYFNWLAENYTVVALALLGLFIISLIIFITVIYKLNKLSRQYRELMQGVEGKNLEEIILRNNKLLEQSLLSLHVMEDKVKTLEKESAKAITRIGIVRFNAFPDVGGDLSYSLALLNQDLNGVVVSSIYSRDDARTYAKPVKEGKSPIKLSEEEKQAMRRAVGEE